MTNAIGGGAGLRILAGEPLSRHTSLRVGGPADFYCSVRTAGMLLGALQFAQARSLPWTVIGSGTNLLVSDKGVRGLVIKCEIGAGDPPKITGLSQHLLPHEITVGEDAGGGEIRVAVGSGHKLSSLVLLLAERGLAGLEWAAGIPGTIGGAIAGNAGAHGGETAGPLRAVEVLEPDGGLRRIPRDELEFSYRSSPWKSGPGTSPGTITAAEFAVEAGDRCLLRELVQNQGRERRKKQPAAWSAGSVFRNPPGRTAGELIEKAGLKGRRAGGAEVSTRHANFIVNTGAASASDVMELVELCRNEVRLRFGIDLQMEITCLGEL